MSFYNLLFYANWCCHIVCIVECHVVNQFTWICHFIAQKHVPFYKPNGPRARTLIKRGIVTVYVYNMRRLHCWYILIRPHENDSGKRCSTQTTDPRPSWEGKCIGKSSQQHFLKGGALFLFCLDHVETCLWQKHCPDHVIGGFWEVWHVQQMQDAAEGYVSMSQGPVISRRQHQLHKVALLHAWNLNWFAWNLKWFPFENVTQISVCLKCGPLCISSLGEMCRDCRGCLIRFST